MYRRRAFTESANTIDPRATWAALGLMSSGMIIYLDQYAEELTKGQTVNGFRLDPLPLRSVRLRRTGPYSFNYIDPSPNRAMVAAIKIKAHVKGSRPLRMRRPNRAKFFYDGDRKPPGLTELKFGDDFEPLDAFVHGSSISEEPSMELIDKTLVCDFWRHLDFTSLAEPFQSHVETL